MSYHSCRYLEYLLLFFFFSLQSFSRCWKKNGNIVKENVSLANGYTFSLFTQNEMFNFALL